MRKLLIQKEASRSSLKILRKLWQFSNSIEWKFLKISERRTENFKIAKRFLKKVENIKKTLAQEVRQKSDISDRRRRLRPLQPLLCWQHVQLGHCATSQGSSYTKNEYNLFYQKFDAEYFFIQQFFRKKLYFLRKPQKAVLGAHLTIF